jgi:hypothetical protein
MRLAALALLSVAAVPPLAAQMPPGWIRLQPLGSEAEVGSPWYGAGLWAGDKHGPPATLVTSAGLGNALIGGGFHLEAGWKTGNWDLAAKWLGVRSATGADYLTLYRGHATWQNRDNPGWSLGLEMEPLVWGYGLNGGYLLGEAARPFPRVRAESPMTPLHFFRVPLGTWGFQAFMGRLENHRVISESMQNPRQQAATVADPGDPQAPFLNGYRVQAEFSDFMEFYANYLNEWGGTLNGRSMLSGYNLGDLATAMFGLKDTLAEAGVDPNQKPSDSPTYRNKARSSSNADVGFRVRSRPVERWLEAESVYGYVSRGSKSMGWPLRVFLRDPARYGWTDIHNDLSAGSRLHFRTIWGNNGRYSVPSLTSPNDTVGALVAWRRLRVGLEYYDGINTTTGAAVRPFNNYLYPTGFYTYGDPLGNALGGETRTTTVRVEADLLPSLTGITILHRGSSPFRDTIDLWQADHPGLDPATDRYVGAQQSFTWRIRPGTTLAAGASWERHGSVDNVPGASKNGFQWFGDLGFQWPVARNGSAQ